jgi:hypothetical protein
MSVGYTESQAVFIKRRIAAAVGRVEAELGRLVALVPDASGPVHRSNRLGEEVRELGAELKGIVDRRTERPLR